MHQRVNGKEFYLCLYSIALRKPFTFTPQHDMCANVRTRMAFTVVFGWFDNNIYNTGVIL